MILDFCLISVLFVVSLCAAVFIVNLCDSNVSTPFFGHSGLQIGHTNSVVGCGLPLSLYLACVYVLMHLLGFLAFITGFPCFLKKLQ